MRQYTAKKSTTHLSRYCYKTMGKVVKRTSRERDLANSVLCKTQCYCRVLFINRLRFA